MVIVPLVRPLANIASGSSGIVRGACKEHKIDFVAKGINKVPIAIRRTNIHGSDVVSNFLKFRHISVKSDSTGGIEKSTFGHIVTEKVFNFQVNELLPSFSSLNIVSIEFIFITFEALNRLIFI